MSKAWTVEQEIHHYKVHADDIPDDYNTETDLAEALITRSALEDRWGQLTAAQQAEIEKIDDQLVQLHARIAEFLPWVRGPGNPRSHWWWRLDEGPGVRDEAKKLS